MTRAKKGRNLTHSIVETLGQSIAAGVYNDKPFPIEAKLCTQFSASRSVVREAVKMLTAKGLIGSRPRQGTWVQGERHWNFLDKDVLSWLLKSGFSYDLMIEFIEYRKAVEPEAAALAARNARPSDLEAIRVALVHMQIAEAGKADPLQSDINFHLAVLDASNNRFIIQNKELVQTVLQYAIKLTNKTKGVQTAELEAHQAIADAIFAGDPVRARAATLAILEEALSLIQEHRPKTSFSSAIS
ncbi:MAG: FadR family transcriptional regulator [Robiginitomaculum sp.]|nr:FadR family transcriptional regulator [Robiginitomaculum sp.]